MVTFYFLPAIHNLIWKAPSSGYSLFSKMDLILDGVSAIAEALDINQVSHRSPMTTSVG